AFGLRRKAEGFDRCWLVGGCRSRILTTTAGASCNGRLGWCGAPPSFGRFGAMCPSAAALAAERQPWGRAQLNVASIRASARRAVGRSPFFQIGGHRLDESGPIWASFQNGINRAKLTMPAASRNVETAA